MVIFHLYPFIWVWINNNQYLLIPFLEGWTSIYQLFWCSPGVQGFDTLPSGYYVIFHQPQTCGHGWGWFALWKPWFQASVAVRSWSNLPRFVIFWRLTIPEHVTHHQCYPHFIGFSIYSNITNNISNTKNNFLWVFLCFSYAEVSGALKKVMGDPLFSWKSMDDLGWNTYVWFYYNMDCFINIVYEIICMTKTF